MKNRGLLLLLAATAICLAQTATDLESDSVNRVAHHLACPCGCKLDMSCRMDPYPCQVCNRFKKQIFSLQHTGKSDDEILDAIGRENGKAMVMSEPGTFAWITPYIAALFGVVFIVWFVRRHLTQPAVAASAPGAPAVDPEALRRYKDRIDKDMDFE